MKNHKIFLVGIGVIIFGALWFTAMDERTVDLATLQDGDVVRAEISGHIFRTEIAKSDTKKERGLAAYTDTSFANDRAMLFLFDEPQQYAFWMKDMQFPIDIIWLRDDHVIDVARSVPVPTTDKVDPPRYIPPSKVDRVLEVRAGKAEDIHAGDVLLLTHI